ncbi:MAG: tripartite tricarboxylate transporter substrate binding protein [Burkholderiales bacterium]|nr:tripartite tricarboxylate transporter substrate binding protein [Burkholderiales bacterium]
MKGDKREVRSPAQRSKASAWRMALGAIALLVVASQAGAQPYPNRPIRLIVPFAPGGGTDILARLIGQKLTESMGQQVVVDNRPGAGGNIGVELAAKAAGDGYTALMVSASYAVNAATYKLNFDPVKDLAPVTQIASVPFVLVSHPSLPANNVKELIELARAKPGQLNYASSGNGSSPHLAGELLAMMSNTKMVHVPYKGGLPALNDVIAGQVQLLFSTVIQGLPFIKSGRLKPIGIASLKRSAALPQVATIHESGVTGFEVTNWFGVLVPRSTPGAIVGRLNAEIVKHLKSPDFAQRLAAEGADPVGNSSAEFATVIAEDIAKFTRVVKEANITVR